MNELFLSRTLHKKELCLELRNFYFQTFGLRLLLQGYCRNVALKLCNFYFGIVCLCLNI